MAKRKELVIVVGLITEEVEVKLYPKNVNYYEDRGYEISKYKDKKGKWILKSGTKIMVKVKDLPDNSPVLVDVQCDGCGKIITGFKWSSYRALSKENGEYYCRKCARNGYKKFLSFYDWCCNNLPKEEADKIILRWDYEKNIDKNGVKVSPKDTTFCSPGLNNKGYWFKCLEHPEHVSELKNIGTLTSGKGSINCKQCNKIVITHPHLIKYFVNIEDVYKHSIGERIFISLKCPECGHRKEMRSNILIKNGFGCPKCSDGIPYTEKFVYIFLNQLVNNIITQLSKKTLEWCKNYRYDNYIEKIDCIIETHGIQHYEECGFKSVFIKKTSLAEIQKNDRQKEKLAKDNNIKNYIILDCRKSELEWIKNSIMKSKLPNLLNFKEEDIDWLKCHEFACNSMVKEVCNLWNEGIQDTKDIASQLKLGRSTVSNYLKRGTKLDWCDYDPKKKSENNINGIRERNSKKVKCITTNEIFNSLTEASKKYKTYISGITNCCKGEIKSAGTLSDGTKLIWAYL